MSYKFDFDSLKSTLRGDLITNNVHRVLYATDASSCQELTLAVTRLKDKEDNKKIITFDQLKNVDYSARDHSSFAIQVVELLYLPTCRTIKCWNLI